MSKGFEVFNVGKEQLGYDVENAKNIINRKLDPKWIKERKQGNTTLSYIGGHTVIRLLNAAFGYQWSFEIVKEEIVQSLPKYDKYKKTTIEQPPVAKVLGRLTVPGLGVKEQYGSKVLIGGATEQESAFKSASTDALKKCASLFGIGLELYGDEEYNFDQEAVAPQEEVKTVAPQPVQEQVPTQPVQQQAPAKPVQQQAQTATTPSGQWNPVDIERLKELKKIVGITDNNQLDPYVREFLDNKNVTWSNITPDNIRAFNMFMSKKAEVI